jgi:hypothetical protein
MDSFKKDIKVLLDEFREYVLAKNILQSAKISYRTL